MDICIANQNVVKTFEMAYNENNLFLSPMYLLLQHTPNDHPKRISISCFVRKNELINFKSIFLSVLLIRANVSI